MGVQEEIANSSFLLTLSPKNALEYAEKAAEKIEEVYQFVRKFCQSESV